jgi:hypothetical protein
MAWLWLNIPPMVLAFALAVGIPLRMVLKDRAKQIHPKLAEPTYIRRIERDDKLAAA